MYIVLIILFVIGLMNGIGAIMLYAHFIDTEVEIEREGRIAISLLGFVMPILYLIGVVVDGYNNRSKN